MAGMVLLDRPTPAGYFIFPDLSVRHEGLYRLSFSLYEDVKEEKDQDPHPVNGSPTFKGNGPEADRPQVHFRLEVKSEAFSVFSAKKFPGLAESTNLSRTVAEQGCRVRIRREVRLRRREKGPETYQSVCDGSPYAASDRYSTPQHMPDRPRSISNASMDAPPPYSVGRRPSIHDPAYYQPNAYPQAPPPPQPSAPVSAVSNYSSHLNFGGPATPTYSKPAMSAPPISAPQHYQPPSNYSTYSPALHSRQTSNTPSYQNGSESHPHGPYGGGQAYGDDRSQGTDSRRTSQTMIGPSDAYGMSNYEGSNSKPPVHTQQQPGSRALTPINTNTQNYHQNPSNTLPSVTSLLQSTPSENTAEPASANSGMPPGPQNPFSATSLPNYSSSSAVNPQSANTYSSDPISSRLHTPYSTTSEQGARLQSPYTSNSEQAARMSKRSYANVFNTSHFNQPQHGGSRPDDLHYAQDILKIETDDGDIQDMYEGLDMPLVYKRANGSQQARKCPSPRYRSVCLALLRAVPS